jgi:hypothetical protein
MILFFIEVTYSSYVLLTRCILSGRYLRYSGLVGALSWSCPRRDDMIELINLAHSLKMRGHSPHVFLPRSGEHIAQRDLELPREKLGIGQTKSLEIPLLNHRRWALLSSCIAQRIPCASEETKNFVIKTKVGDKEGQQFPR